MFNYHAFARIRAKTEKLILTRNHKDRCDDTVVSALAFYSNNPSSFPAVSMFLYCTSRQK